MAALNANLQVTAGQLPAGVCYDHDENSRLQAFAARLIVSLSAEFATFQYGDVAPSSDLGPWFNTIENEWWVWSDVAGMYIAQVPTAVKGQVPIGFIGNWGGTIASIATYFNALGGQWRFCNGDAISRGTYAELFGIIGTQYGAGDGLTTFALPDLRNFFVAGANSDDAGTAKTNVGDGAALLKSRVYADHKHNDGDQTTAGLGHSAGNSYSSGALDMASNTVTITPIRVLPPFLSLAYVIRIL